MNNDVDADDEVVNALTRWRLRAADEALAHLRTDAGTGLSAGDERLCDEARAVRAARANADDEVVARLIADAARARAADMRARANDKIKVWAWVISTWAIYAVFIGWMIRDLLHGNFVAFAAAGLFLLGLRLVAKPRI
ncbi:MAG: hypothetical protein WBQ43_01425 [Terriglobales bacterium]